MTSEGLDENAGSASGRAPNGNVGSGSDVFNNNAGTGSGLLNSDAGSSSGRTSNENAGSASGGAPNETFGSGSGFLKNNVGSSSGGFLNKNAGTSFVENAGFGSGKGGNLGPGFGGFPMNNPRSVSSGGWDPSIGFGGFPNVDEGFGSGEGSRGSFNRANSSERPKESIQNLYPFMSNSPKNKNRRENHCILRYLRLAKAPTRMPALLPAKA